MFVLLRTRSCVRAVGLAALCGLAAACGSATDPVPHPSPALLSVTPDSVLVGLSPGSLTLQGRSFTSASVVRISGATRTTRFVDESTLQVDLTTVEVGLPGSLSVTVYTPPPGGGESNALQIPALFPRPTLEAVTPSVLRVGDPDAEIVFRGSGFVGGGSPSRIFLTAFGPAPANLVRRVSSDELRLTLTAPTFTQAYQVWAWVENAGPGGGESNRILFTVENVIPLITGVSPTTAIVGTPVTLGIGGEGFAYGNAEPVVRWNGVPVPTYLVWGSGNSFSLKGMVPAALVASSGPAAVTVFNPPPGGGESAPFWIEVSVGGRP